MRSLMPRKPNSVPAYCLHRASRKAVVRINGRDHYLGPYDSDESRAEYDRLIAEWLARGRQSTEPTMPSENESRSVNEVLLAYVDFAEAHYFDGQHVSTELANVKHALKVVKQLYGHTPAEQFGPLALKAIRQHMIDVQKLRSSAATRSTNGSAGSSASSSGPSARSWFLLPCLKDSAPWTACVAAGQRHARRPRSSLWMTQSSRRRCGSRLPRSRP